jgi:mono/diheme cytochrome c family protein
MTRGSLSLLGAIATLTSLVMLGGCDRMIDQPKRVGYEVHRPEQALTEPWQPPPGTVAQDSAPPPPPPVVTRALIERGRERFDIYCAMCHGPAGYGDGQVVQRGFPAPPSYHDERLRDTPNQHFYDVITNGFGLMYSYAQRVAPSDRWAIVAYIRALQASQHMPAAALTPEQRAQLPATEGPRG